MFGVTNILEFILASLVVILVPGPATLIISMNARISSRFAFASTLGIVMGDILLILASVLGVSSIIHIWPNTLEMVKYAGLSYLAFISIQMIIPNKKIKRKSTRKQLSITTKGEFLKAIILTLTNPKPIIFFISFFPIYLAKEQGPAWQGFLFLGFIFEIMNTLYFMIIIAVIRYMSNRMILSEKINYAIKPIAGLTLLFFVFMGFRSLP